MRRETLAEKTARLVRPAGGSDAPPSVAPRPTLLQSSSFMQPEVREAILEKERLAAEAARQQILDQANGDNEEENPEDVFDRLQSLARNGGEDFPPPPPDAKPDETSRDEEAVEVSSYDKDLLEMVDSLDVGELILTGQVAAELDIVEGRFSVSVKSLRKADLIEIQKDIDEYQRGMISPDEDGERVYPSQVAVDDYAELRHVAQGLLGMNSKSLPADASTRMEIIAQLATPVYQILLREYSKFLRAVALLFPDEPTKKQMDKLRETLKKA